MPFKTRLWPRLVLITLVLLLVLLGQALWIQKLANEHTRQHQLTGARDHYASLLSELDRRWGREAFNLKSRIESLNILDGKKTSKDQLLAFLISQGSSIEFPSLRIEKTSGELIAYYDYASHVDPKMKFHPGQNTSWVQNPADGTLYLVIRQFIWLGNENGYLILFKPMDHALLTQHTYPSTRLSLWWKGHAVASSNGEDGLRALSANSIKPERDEHAVVMTWSGPETDSAPKLLIEILRSHAVDGQALIKPVMIGFSLMMIACVIAFWSLQQRAQRQILALAEARKRFSRLGTLDEETEQALRVAQTGPIEELGSVAVSIEKDIRSRLNQAD